MLKPPSAHRRPCPQPPWDHEHGSPPRPGTTDDRAHGCARPAAHPDWCRCWCGAPRPAGQTETLFDMEA
jgi:hypothetical protein